MKTLDCKITFNTPAFLGNAEQNGQWRTPPFKALLRQWWRVAYAAQHANNLTIEHMREEEGQLFGVASDKRHGSRQSQLRLRLDRWELGAQKDWRGLETARVVHPEVTNQQGNAVAVGAQLYLGYGPLGFAQGQTALKKNAAIQAGESATLSIAFQEAHEPLLQTAISLIDHYGTIGGRSRNGWGSFQLSASDNTVSPTKAELVKAVQRPWREALRLDWPNAIGIDDRQRPLIWQTSQSFPDWKSVMRQLAKLKIELRTQQFPFHGMGVPQARHWLSYPVTHHTVPAWGNNARLPNSLRFKVRVTLDGTLRGLIVHVPCLPPNQPFQPNRQTVESIWSRVHAYLDQAEVLTRTPE
ncbi:MAG: hypothetical protein VBE63_23525 [Lamprobacter sp.]|uniref:RAMP superfamily CRISPR-associated protein n=1 Tax=Lamprobacter sp. TaxID=3100796 RepID=UPI002B25A62B|nr:RAMP superfamily CRISPR-associated protein [Lamprobacter sp.]MEA3642887.1 hypothetical protein [Lamprobacter sp.]